MRAVGRTRYRTRPRRDHDLRAFVSRLAKLLFRVFKQDVREAQDGPEALAIAGGVRLEDLLLDHGIPEMGGFEVARGRKNRRTLVYNKVLGESYWI